MNIQIKRTKRGKAQIIYEPMGINMDIGDLAKSLNLSLRGMRSRLRRYNEGLIDAEEVFKKCRLCAGTIDMALDVLRANPCTRYTAKQIAMEIGVYRSTASNMLSQLCREGQAFKDTSTRVIEFWYRSDEVIKLTDYHGKFFRALSLVSPITANVAML